MQQDESRWYAARTKPRQEQVAVENLTRQNFEVYSPLVQIEKLRARRISVVREPLFPGYVLVKLVLATSIWRVINSTRGVSSLLMFGENGVPTPLPTREVERIKSREKAGQLFISEIHRVQRGDRVRLKIGPAADKIGKVIFTRGERVALLLNLLGRDTRVSVPLHALEVLGSPAHQPLGRTTVR